MMNLLIKGGRLMDPSRGLDEEAELLLVDGHVETYGKEIKSDKLDGARVIDAGGCLVIPGMIDIHAHVATGLVDLCVPPDEAGVLTGAVAVCDAGSLGWENFEEGRRLMDKTSKTAVCHLMHLAPKGETTLPETGYELYDQERIRQVIQKNRDVIVGIKVRLVENALLFDEYDIFRKAADLAHENGLPLMVHLGERALDRRTANDLYQATERIIGYLEKGDILTHIFTPAAGGLFRDGEPIPGMDEVYKKGIRLDASPGRGHMSFRNLLRGMELGIYPDLTGTDVVNLIEPQPHFYNLAIIVSKLLAAGMPFTKALSAVTTNPAETILKPDRCPSVKGGAVVDFTLLKMDKGEYLFHDGMAGNMIRGDLLLRPWKVIRAGITMEVDEKLKAHEPSYSLMRSMFPENPVLNENKRGAV